MSSSIIRNDKVNARLWKILEPDTYKSRYKLSHTIRPTIDLTPYLQEVCIETHSQYWTRTAASGVGYTNILEVPDGEHWTVYSVYAGRQVGDGTCTGLVAYDVTGTITVQLCGVGSSGWPKWDMEQMNMPAQLDEGQGLAAYVDAITQDTTFTIWIYYIKTTKFGGGSPA